MPIASKVKPAAPAKPAAAAAKPVAAAAPAAAKTMQREAYATVTTTILENGTVRGEPITAEEREVKVFVTNPGFTSLKLGYNRAGAAHMELIKIDVSVGMPHYVEESDNAALQVLDKAKALLELAASEFAPSTGDTVGVDEDLEPPAAEDEAEVAAEEPAAEEGEINKAYLQTADLETLQGIATGNPDLGIDPNDYAEESDLREVLILSIDPDGADAEGIDAAGGETAPYTEADLKAATLDELKAVYESWDMGKFPPGPEKLAKPVAVKKILERQAAASA